jgi:hypothetical protein
MKIIVAGMSGLPDFAWLAMFAKVAGERHSLRLPKP